MQHRIEALEAQNSRLIEFEHENRRLKQLLSFSDHTGFKGVPSTVIGRDPSNWVRTITIDKGSDDGVRPNLAVVDGNALVGQTTVVNRTSSTVRLVTDVTSAVDSIVHGNRTPGIVEGTGQETLRLRYVPKEVAVPTGGRISTAGLGGVYPKGLLVGVVTRTDTQVSGMFQGVEVQPNVDLLRLENVMVIIPEDSKPIEQPAEPNASAEQGSPEQAGNEQISAVTAVP